MNKLVIQIIAGLACTFFFLALALHRVPIAAVGAILAHADPLWILAALLAYAANLALRTWRWQMILRPVANIPYPTVAKSLVVGYGLNVIMPARLGELFRGEFLKQTYGLSRLWALTSIVIERLFDGLAVIGFLGIGLLLAAFNGKLSAVLVGVLASACAIFGTILLIALCLAGPSMSRVFTRFPGLSAQLRIMQQGFRILRTWRTLEVAALTLVVYVPDASSLWFAVKALGLALGPADTLVLVGAASLSTLVPSGPAFLGTLQLAYALAIEFAGAPRALGIAAATLVQLCLLLPVAIAATGVLIHGSGSAMYDIFTKKEADDATLGQ